MATIAICGIGELGGVFARGLLRCGHHVVPVTRHQDPADLGRRAPEVEHLLVAVGENAFEPLLRQIPERYRGKLAFVQNELLPRDWQCHGVARPTMIVVWFEKKPGRDVHVLLPSQLHGPGAELFADALLALDIDARVVLSESELLREMVAKNLYILAVNSAGLEVGGTTGQLWCDHRELAVATARDVIRLQQALAGQPLDERELLERFERALLSDPEHRCTGRTAPARLERALTLAKQLEIETPTLERLARCVSERRGPNRRS